MVLTVLRASFVLLAVYAGFLVYGALTTRQVQSEWVKELKVDTVTGKVVAEGAPEYRPVEIPASHVAGPGLLVLCVGGALLFSIGIVTIDLVLPRKSLAAISGLFLGLLVGLVFAFVLGMVVKLLISTWWPDEPPPFVTGINVVLGLVCCFLTISFILQTKDDIRFVIPYVEFAKQTKGARPLLLDTSVIIDGRIADIAEQHLIESQMVVPRFVLAELQTIADSSDKLKRNRGRRGLDVLNRLQGNDKVDVAITDPQMVKSEGLDVDHKLVALGKSLAAKIATNDYNLNKIAQLQGVDVININDLATALRPVVLPGENINVKVIKPGEEVGQGVGYLDDGTMVVGEHCRDMIGQEVQLTVTSVLQTSAGRMIFGRRDSDPRRR
ncbi:MAG: hypothetical protein BIFFINMI_01156 [Phycisphaerae bacterium]|nr:hypothetical protein [Phycisphaerae bacterium]